MARHLAHRAATVQQPAKSAEANRMNPESYRCVMRSDRPNSRPGTVPRQIRRMTTPWCRDSAAVMF
jgi:hypothetical protein